MVSLQFSCFRRSFKQAQFVQSDLVPFLDSINNHTFHWITNGAPQLRRIFGPDSSIPFENFPDALRHFASCGDLALGFHALSWVEHVHARVSRLPGGSLANCSFAFDVGDVVVNKQLGQLGVVAARLPVCFESDLWVEEHLGTVCDRRLSAPWYLILVGHHRGVPCDFSRYGSELTHERVSGVKSIGLNRHLPLYFRGFDCSTGRYVQRDK